MPEFVLSRNYTLRTLHGHTINFVKGEPIHVPPVCIHDALTIGAVPVDGPMDILDPEQTPAPELSLDERQAALLTAFKMLEERNGRTDFSGQGLPNKAALEKIVEFSVEKREFEPLWAAYVAEKSNVE